MTAATRALGAARLSPDKLRLALVLGSGGVKSIAALGVAEVLFEAGLKPDLVVGCSAGAVFGALLACGHAPREAMAMATRLWSRDITSERKPGAWFDLARCGFQRDAKVPFGDRFAMRDDRLIRERLRAAFGATTWDELSCTFRVRATDAHTGGPVTLEHGLVWEALRASVALPFLFAPLRLDGRTLVDGSVCDPLPLSAASDAQAVVAVGFDVPMPKHVRGPTRLATRVTASLTNNLMQAQVAAHQRPNTFVLMPELGRRVGLFETDAMPYLIEQGRQAARQVLPSLLKSMAHVASHEPLRADTTNEDRWRSSNLAAVRHEAFIRSGPPAMASA